MSKKVSKTPSGKAINIPGNIAGKIQSSVPKNKAPLPPPTNKK